MTTWKDAWKADSKLPKGLQVGKLIKFQIGDGYSVYKVLKIGKKVSEIKHDEFEGLDNYINPAFGEKGIILTSQLQKIIEYQERLKELFDEKE